MEFNVLECRKGAPKYLVSMYMHAHRRACRPPPILGTVAIIKLNI